MDYVIDAFLILVKVILALGVIDLLLLLFIYRVKVLSRNVDRRLREKGEAQRKEALKKNDAFWEPYVNGEFYDPKPNRPALRKVGR